MAIHRRSTTSPTTRKKKHQFDEKRALASSDTRSKKYLERDIDELNKIIEFIGNKEFSIVLNEH